MNDAITIRSKRMKVGEVVAALQRFDQNLDMMTEGCDCFGDVGSVTIDPDDPTTVILWRPKE